MKTFRAERVATAGDRSWKVVVKIVLSLTGLTSKYIRIHGKREEILLKKKLNDFLKE